MEELARQNPDLVINISASPFSYTKTEARENIFISKAKKYRVPVISVNQTGANTELIFDGASIIVNREGSIFRHLEYFKEELFTFSTDDLMNGTIAEQEQKPDPISLIHKALVTGIRITFKIWFKKHSLGLSGGLDSAVSTCLAAEALGSENVRVLLMPAIHRTIRYLIQSPLLPMPALVMK
jgi:NAD+ synthase (glutamine-hydrolysing)